MSAMEHRDAGEERPERSLVDLPSYVERPLEVYVNGVAQRAGVDYELVGRTLVFPRALVAERPMTRVQWALATLGIAGVYRTAHLVDVVYERDGRRGVATGLRPRPAGAEA